MATAGAGTLFSYHNQKFATVVAIGELPGHLKPYRHQSSSGIVNPVYGRRPEHWS